MELVERVYRGSLEALEVVSRYAHRTPLEHSATFSRATGLRVYLKYENMQKTGSFKVRGALYKVWRLRGTVEGVVAASAGNHAQGVAYAASCLGLRSVIVMPVTASIAKVEATRGYGAEVVLYGEVYDDAERKAREIAEERGYAFVHAFDDPEVIAGQATVGHELLDQLGDVDVVVVPIGGGGLASGVAVVLKKRRPRVKIIGVEPENAAKMLASIRAGHPVEIEPRPTIADGLVTKRPGRYTYALVSELVDDIVTVSEEEIAHAIYMLLERCKVLAEGAGAASLAALLSGKVEAPRGAKTVAIVSGGNIDLTQLYRVLLRGLAEEGRIVVLDGYVPDTPGTLARIASIVASHRGNIVDVVHERTDLAAPAWHTRLMIVAEVPSRRTAEEIVEELNRRGYRFRVAGR